MSLFNKSFIALASICGVGLLSFVYAWNGIAVDFSSSYYISSSKHRCKHLPETIGIVGGGIGGTSAGYFLRQLFGKDVQIDLYEPNNKLGGRIATVEIANRFYESGASILHPKNMYAKAIAEKFDLKDAQSADTFTALFDGKDYILQTSQWSIMTFFKFLWMFGLDFLRLMWFEKAFMDKFLVIYDLQKQGQSFTSAESLLKTINGNQFINATEITGCKLFADKRFGENLVTNLVNGGLRANYGQTCSVNGFVTMVSMAGIQPGLWAVNGGNFQLATKIFENSRANLLQEQVTKISQHSSGKFVIQTKNSENRLYDIVVVATPINRDKSNIDVKEICSMMEQCPSADSDPRRYRRTVATFVKGKLNPELFKCDSLSSCPDGVLMTKDLFYRSIGLTSPVDFDPAKGDSINDTVYKVFSTDLLTDLQLSTLFVDRTEKAEVDWRAYPLYQPPDRLDTFVLNEDGVYYTSPIEWAASAMEMSLISAKNVALLAYNKWHGIDENIDSVLSSEEHSEL